MASFGVRIYTAPASEPVTVAEAKSRLRITTTDEDTDIGTLITQAREMAEAECQRALITQTLTLTMDDFPRYYREGRRDDYATYFDRSIRLPRPPLVSVTHVKYYDGDGVQQTVDAATYSVATGGEPGRIAPLSAGYWPAVQYLRPEAVEVRYVAGYGNAASVPAAAKAAILIIMAALRDDPTGAAGIPAAARRMLDTLEYGEVR